MLERDDLSDQQIEDELFGCRVGPGAKKPLVEALFQAYLFSPPGIAYVGHVHSLAVNQVFCTPRARDFAERCLFPDEIDCCSMASAFVPDTDPGPKLSQVIRQEVAELTARLRATPRVILLENHAITTMVSSPSAVKAAQTFIGAAALGGPMFLEPAQVDRVANRIDEDYHQRALKL